MKSKRLYVMEVTSCNMCPACCRKNRKALFIEYYYDYTCKMMDRSVMKSVMSGTIDPRCPLEAVTK